MNGANRVAALVAAILLVLQVALSDDSRVFEIKDNQFVKNGKPIQIISGSIHYFRVHPYYWEDRLLKMKAMGLNAIEMYVAWNHHELNPGEFKWDGPQDVERFIGIAHKLGFLVILRPGPYICAEWNFGGFPAWLGSSVVTGGGTMKLRSSDPLYLAHVDRYFNELLPRMVPLLYSNGGPIIMIQIENEFSFLAKEQGQDETYLRHLTNTAKSALDNNDVTLFTTDPPPDAEKGTLRGELYAAVDYNVGWYPDFDTSLGKQQWLNGDNPSPPFCSEFYCGWITRMGENMSNPTFQNFLDYMKTTLDYQNKSGSMNIYMAHGGSNFGWFMGGQVDSAGSTVEYTEGRLEPQTVWSPVIQSYDYGAPISEAGDYGQPGIGPPPDGPANRYMGIREFIQNYTGQKLPAVPPRPRIAAYGEVVLSQQGTLLSQLGNLVDGIGIYSETPKPMEEYGQWNGHILYRHVVSASDLGSGATIYVGETVRDSAVILADGVYVGSLERNKEQAVILNDAANKVASEKDGQNVNLDILIMQIGRANFNLGKGFDLKGLVSGIVLLNKEPLTGWRVFPLPLTSLDGLNLPDVSKPAAPAAIAPTAAASKSTTAAKNATAAKSAAAVKLAAAATKPAAAVKPGAAAKFSAAAESASHAHVQPRPTAAAVSFAAVQTPKAELAKEMEQLAISGDYPAIAAMVASDGGEACPVKPAGSGSNTTVPNPAVDGPTFYRGYFNVNGSLADANGMLPDTYMNVGNFAWAKGVAFINGFNLGYYWPEVGPQNTIYIPGPLLRACNNELVLLELGTTMTANASAMVLLTDQADFHGRPGPKTESLLAVESSGAYPDHDPSYYWRTGVKGGHLIPGANLTWHGQVKF